MFPGDEVVTVRTPAFAESVTEGDVRWEKGNSFYFKLIKRLSVCSQTIKLNFLLTAVGDTVSEDEVVCEIETDKVII